MQFATQRIAQQHRSEAISRRRTFVSIPEEACILAKGTRGLVGSQHQLGIEGGRAGLSASVDARGSIREICSGVEQQPGIGSGVNGSVVRGVGAGCWWSYPPSIKS